MLRQRESHTPTPRPVKRSRVAVQLSPSKSVVRSLCFDVEKPKKSSGKSRQWTFAEEAAMVQYIALYYCVDDHGDKKNPWPATKDEKFWGKCAEAVAYTSKNEQREWQACRTRCTKHLRDKFGSVSEAEVFYNINYNSNFDISDPNLKSTPSRKIPPLDISSPMANFSPVENLSTPSTPGEYFDNTLGKFSMLSQRQRMGLLSQLFKLGMMAEYPEVPPSFVPSNFMPLIMNGLSELHYKKQENTFLHLAQSLQLREHSDATRMPLDRMPWPMLAYNIKFFAVDNAEECKCPDKYKQYMETMYTYFGNKWLSLHCGPMWAFEDTGNCETQIPDAVDDASGNVEDTDILALAMESCGIEISDAVDEQSDINQEWEREECNLNEENNINLSQSLLDYNENQLNLHWESERPEVTDDTEQEITACSVNTLFGILSSAEAKELDDPHVCDMSAVHGIVPQTTRPGRDARDPLKAKVNIAGVSKRTLTRRIEKSGYTKDTSIQVEVLRHVQEKIKDGRWWIKADATDMRAGLRESVKNEWTGDVDLGTGSLEELKTEYAGRLLFSKQIGIGSRRNCTLQDLNCLHAKLDDDIIFLQKGLQSSKVQYTKKKKQLNASEDSLFALAWDVEGYEKLLETCQEILGAVKEVISMLNGSVPNFNVPQKLSTIRSKVKVYTKGLFLKKRETASHLLVFMISDERRNMKPYAVPVRVLPIRVISDDYIRELKDQLKNTMKALGMVVVGFVTDGEFNSLRTKGSTRPVSIIQLSMEAKMEARSTKVTRISEYLTLHNENDNPRPMVHHPAVPLDDVVWIHNFMEVNNASFDDAIHVLKRKLFPLSYDPHPWVAGKLETRNDCLKSLFTIYLFRYKVKQWSQHGVDFINHLYVPEVEDNENQQDREDHGHLLKRIGQCTRSGSIPNLNLVHFVKALQSPNTGLTYTALTGKRKQSVVDVERMLSPAVADFFEKEGYSNEAHFVRIVSNWHKATDGRGLTEEVRAGYNTDMLHYLLDDWMPWHVYMRDYSTLDPNRPIKGIQGMTREVIVGLIANIESAERRRLECRSRGLSPEHPRAGTSDDVEGFFSILHSLLGRIFDHKSFLDNYRKICNEFSKRVDPDLPYYYWTGAEERYTIGSLPNFNQPSAHGVERLDRVHIQTRSDPGVFQANRASLPQRGSRTVRMRYHNLPEPLPPPPRIN